MSIEDFRTFEAYGKAYGELVDLLQDGKITSLEFIRQQDDLSSEYDEFIACHHLLENEYSAEAFLTCRDDSMPYELS